MLAVEMNLAWNLTERESLILHYDSVKELGGLACFQRFFFFTLISGQSRIECVAFTLLRKAKTQKLGLKALDRAEKGDDNRKDKKALRGKSLLLQKCKNFGYHVDYHFPHTQTFINLNRYNITPPYAPRRESRFA